MSKEGFMIRVLKIFLALLFLPPVAFSSEKIIENFQDKSVFSVNSAPRASVELSSAAGFAGGVALRLDYDLRNDHYVEVGRAAEIDFGKAGEFRWHMKGDAKGSILELKFVDADGSVYGKKIPISDISAESWKSYSLKAGDCHYLWGGDQKLDRIISFYMALSRGAPRRGFLEIDEFGYSEKLPEEPGITVNINQAGYLPQASKRFVVRLDGVSPESPLRGEFIVFSADGTPIFKSGLINEKFSDWRGSYLSGDFSALTAPGRYKLHIVLKAGGREYEKDSYAFEIGSRVYSNTIPLELNYLKYQRCGIRCHKKDPVMGGYHDTLFDISKRMWSLPSLVFAMAEYNRGGLNHADSEGNGVADDLEELIWGLEFVNAVAEPDGTVSWGGIEADFTKYMTHEQFIARINPLRPEDDDLSRIKYKDKNLFSTAFNIPALLSGAKQVRAARPELASAAEKTAFKAWDWLNTVALRESRDYGAYLWASSELYKYTNDKKYISRVGELLPKLLALQAKDFDSFENGACGDFFRSDENRDFLFRYKYVSFNIAINLALLNICDILPKDDPQWLDCYYACSVFAKNYLKNMASKTPYRQVSCGLEMAQGDKLFFKQNYFAGPEAEQAAAANHGLNCDHLGLAYVALKSAALLKDRELYDFADNQINWVLGVNPLDYCMLLGAGSNNPEIMAEYFDKPKLNGIIPNGIVGSGPNDEPQWWGEGTSSGEDWLPHNAAYLLLLSEIEGERLAGGEKSMISVSVPKKIAAGRPFKIDLKLDKSLESLPFKVFIKGGELADKSSEIVSKGRLSLTAVPKGGMPLLVRVEFGENGSYSKDIYFGSY